MFPTTIWTTIRRAGESDAEALDRFVRSYRAPVVRWLAGRGFAEGDAEDLCHDAFVRLLRGGVLAKADAERGRFRSLLLSVVKREAIDRARRDRVRSLPELPESERPIDVADDSESDPDFDREWALELVERALARMRAEAPDQHAVLAAHLAGERPDRQRLWHARKKLVALIRHEVASTCTSPAQLADELAHLSPYLRPRRKGGDA